MTDKTIWQQLRQEAELLADSEPLLECLFRSDILQHESFEQALVHNIASRFHTPAVSERMLKGVFETCLLQSPQISRAAIDDMIAYYERDPACDKYCRPFLNFKGYTALQTHRFAHDLWTSGRKSLARHLHHLTSVLFDVDIHPAAKIGSGVMFDHATAIVIGETAVVGNDVSMLHGVTLGGSGCESAKRHPTVGNGVMISCGAKLLGNISIGENVKIGGGSVVLTSVPAHVTVAGVPAKIVGTPDEETPALSMNQNIISQS